MSLFKPTSKENERGGPIQAWEYNGKLYKTEEERNRAEKVDQFYLRRAKIVKVLAGEGYNSSLRYRGTCKSNDGVVEYTMYEDPMGDVKEFSRMTPDQFANHLIAHWDYIKRNVDKIMIDGEEN